jgi:hypothetical protein
MLARALALIALLPSLALGQQSDSSKQVPVPGALQLGLNDSTSRRIAQDMAKDLLRLRKAEESYYAAHHAYAYDVAELAPFKMTPGNIVGITQTTGGGFRAVATNPALPGAEFEADVPAPAH